MAAEPLRRRLSRSIDGVRITVDPSAEIAQSKLGAVRLGPSSVMMLGVLMSERFWNRVEKGAGAGVGPITMIEAVHGREPDWPSLASIEQIRRRTNERLAQIGFEIETVQPSYVEPSGYRLAVLKGGSANGR